MKSVSRKRFIIFVIVGLALNVLGRAFTMGRPDIPLYLNFTGVFLASYFAGSIAGTAVSLFTVVFGIVYGFYTKYTYIYAEASFIVPMIVASIFVGGFARKYQAFSKLYNTFGTYALVATSRSIVMMIVSGIFYKGHTGIKLCDIIMDYQDSISGPQILKTILPSMIATFFDTFITLFVLYLAINLTDFIKSKINKNKTAVKGGAALLIFVGVLLAQMTISPLEAKAISGDNFIKKVYSSEQGLLGGASNSIVQRKDGSIWVGTYGGVYKYNGTDFVMMRDMPGARSVESLYVDDADNLWISSNGTGLVVRTAGNDIISISDEDGLPSNTVRAVTKVRDNIYYVGTVDAIAIVYFDGEKLEVQGTIPQVIYAKRMVAASDGTVIATTSAGESYLIKEDKVVDVFSEEESINEAWILSDSEAYLCGRNANLYKVSIKGKHFTVIETKHIDELDSIKCILLSSDGTLYVSGGDKIGYINEKGLFGLIQTGDFDSSIEQIMEDYQGNIWFSSSRCGLLELSASSFTNLFDVCNVNKVGANTVKEWNGLLYVGTDKGLYVLDEEKSVSVENYFTDFFAEKRIRALEVDGNNHLWVCTQTDGAYEIESEEVIYNYSVDDGLPDVRARCTLSLSDGRTMVSTYSGISYIEDHKVTESLVINEDLSAAYPLCLVEKDERTVIVGTNGDGICILKDGKAYKYITHKDGIPSGVILNIYKDKIGDGYFVLSGSGMCYMDVDYSITEFSEFPFYNNTDIFQSANGDVIVLSTAGVYIVSYDELMSFGPVNALHLDETMGLPGSVTSNARNHMTEEDILYFAGSTGVYRLDCSDYYIKVNSYIVNISSIEVDGEVQQISEGEEILLAPGINKFSINLELYNYTTTNPYIRYFLDGVDAEPVTILAGDLQEIQYYGIQSGVHTLTVEVLEPNEQEVLATYTFKINKSMEPYESLEFKIFYVFGVGLIGVTFVIWIAIIVIDLNARSQKIKYSEALSEMEKEKAEALEKSLEREELANRSKSDFLANMSHEIRTPINAIIGMDTMILRESKQDEIKKYAKNIYGASSTLLSLINDILDFSKIESGKMELVLSEYNLGTLINDINVMMRPKAETKHLKFMIEAKEDIPVKLWGDEGRIKQILINILNNAVKYTEKGYVNLKIDYEEAADNNIRLICSVSDTGIGIKKEDLGKLFSAFDRIEENRNKNIEGTGLGMSITKNLLAMMGSELKVNSVYGMGSEFSFEILQPVKGEERLGNYEDYATSSVMGMDEAEEFHAPDATILVVDDVEMNLIVVQSLLKRTQINIDTADSGMQAIEMAKLKSYDIIFLDAMMPKMDGIETLGIIRSKCMLNINTPVIMLTANAIKGAKEEYLEKGFNNYLSKPINERELEKMVLHYLPENKVILSGEKDFTVYNPGEEASAKEYDEFIEFMRSIDGINVVKGVEAAGGEDTYKILTKNFFDTSAMRIGMLKDLFEKKEVADYTIQVHALKSSARIIGALKLSEMAFAMEMAGKKNDWDAILKGTPDVIKAYESIYDKLSQYYSAKEEGSSDNKKDITASKMRRRLGEVKELLEAFDYESAKELFEELKSEYKIPDEFKEAFVKMQGAFAEADRDLLIELINEFV